MTTETKRLLNETDSIFFNSEIDNNDLNINIERKIQLSSKFIFFFILYLENIYFDFTFNSIIA